MSNLEKALLERRTTHLHFACHGEFMPEDPLNSALLLANDEVLDLREILTAPSFAKIGAVRLVTLSACQTALIDCARLPEEPTPYRNPYFGSGFVLIGS